jgi:hypothetical protein
MKKTISYLLTPDWEFYVYLRDGKKNIEKMLKKEKELQERYGGSTTKFGEIPHVYRQHKELKKYYGTVWIAYNPKENRYVITDHYSQIKEDVKKRGYKLKKFELEPYEENYWRKSHREKVRVKEEMERDLNDLREMME